MTSTQVVSRDRVRDHGEVFTNEREVSAMLELVDHETRRIDSRFLEPACGTGNFLAPVLERKIALVRKKYGRSQVEFERQALIAVGSVYGIDLLSDNVKECRQRLFTVFETVYSILYKRKCKDPFRDSIRFVLKKNIIVGNALTLKTEGKTPRPITFSTWSLPFNDSRVKRHDFLFEELSPAEDTSGSLFVQKPNDIGETSFIPKSVKEYPLTHVLHLAYAANN